VVLKGFYLFMIIELFQDLLTRGDLHLHNAEHCEKKGDLLYALRYCSEATCKFSKRDFVSFYC